MPLKLRTLLADVSPVTGESMHPPKKIFRSNKGQGLIEYLIIVAIVVVLWLLERGGIIRRW